MSLYYLTFAFACIVMIIAIYLTEQERKRFKKIQGLIDEMTEDVRASILESGSLKIYDTVILYETGARFLECIGDDYLTSSRTSALIDRHPFGIKQSDNHVTVVIPGEGIEIIDINTIRRYSLVRRKING